jgi:hypothetical protein
MSDCIETKLDLLLLEVSRLRKDVDDLKSTCGRMDGHISFVERTYTTIRLPFMWILSHIPFTRTELPEIKGDRSHVLIAN